MKFTEEEIRENVIVPAGVEMELIRLVEEKLNQCGVFYRVYSRIKKASSLERKYNDKEYDNVLREGRVIESGTHDALMEKKGFYYSLHNSQYDG